MKAADFFAGACVRQMCKEHCNHHCLRECIPCPVHLLDPEALLPVPRRMNQPGLNPMDVRVRLERAQHKYRINGVDPSLLLSVTQLLGKLFSTFEDFVSAKLKYQKTFKSAHKFLTNMSFATVKGELMHRYCALWWQHEGSELERDEAIKCSHPAWSAIVKNFQELKEDGWELFRSELPVAVVNLALVGTPDIVLRRRIRVSGRSEYEFYLLDFKTSSIRGSPNDGMFTR